MMYDPTMHTSSNANKKKRKSNNKKIGIMLYNRVKQFVDISLQVYRNKIVFNKHNM